MSESNSHLLVAPLTTRGSTAMDPSQVSKTPTPAGRTTTKARRALGDISNHRRVAAATSTTVKPPTGTNTGSLIFHRTDYKSSKPLKSSPPTKKAPRTISSKVPSTTTATSTTTNRFRANDSHQPHPQLIQPPSLAQQQKVVVFDLDPDDDEEVEVPAGRLWMHQNVWAEDDASSVDLSLEGAKTGRAEILQALEDRYQRRLEWEQAEEEREARQLDDAVKRVFQSGKWATGPCILHPQTLLSSHFPISWITDLDDFDPSPCEHVFDPEDPALDSLVSADDASFGHVDISF